MSVQITTNEGGGTVTLRRRKVVIQSLPKSWWAIYTEALCNSRGQQTEYQLWCERMRRDAKLMRDIDRTVWRRLHGR